MKKYKIIRIAAGIVFGMAFCFWGYNKLLYLDADVTYKDLVHKVVEINYADTKNAIQPISNKATSNTTLECYKNAETKSKGNNRLGAIDEIKKMADCNEKNELIKTIGENLKNEIEKNAGADQFSKANGLIKKEYSTYKTVTGQNIEEIEKISSSLTGSAVRYAQDMLDKGDYSSLKNALEQLRSIDSGNEALLLEKGNAEVNQLSKTMNTYKSVVSEVKTAETAYNNGNYESALNTINAAFEKSEMVKNNYTDLYNKINAARQNEIEAAKRAEEERKRAEEAAKRAEEEAKQAAEREAANNKKIEIKGFAFSNLEAWQNIWEGNSPNFGYYKYYNKYFAFDIENIGSSTVYLSKSDFYFALSNGEYKDVNGIYKYNELVNQQVLLDVDSKLRPGETRRCVIKVTTQPPYGGDKIYFKDELITTVNG